MLCIEITCEWEVIKEGQGPFFFHSSYFQTCSKTSVLHLDLHTEGRKALEGKLLLSSHLFPSD